MNGEWGKDLADKNNQLAVPGATQAIQIQRT